jgi:long-chain acyl-CoA synthetase
MRDNKKTILLTGATGLVGSYLLKVLLQKSYKVYVLARSKDNKDARDRVLDILKFWDKDVLSGKARNLVIMEGDITKKNLGLDKQSTDLLTKEIKEIFHCAAVTNYNWKLKDIRKINVLGTKKILNFAMQCKKNKEFKKINYVSSAYVCGKYKAIFRENDLDVGQKFNTAYEQSKFEAEKLIEVYRNKGLWVDIFRPSIVVGESTTGRIPVFQQHFYQVFRIWSLGIFDYFPVKDCFANITPVDELSESMIIISLYSTIQNKNYHLFNSRKISFKKVLNTYKNFMNVKKPRAVSPKQLSKLYFTPIQKIILKNLFFTFNCSSNSFINL